MKPFITKWRIISFVVWLLGIIYSGFAISVLWSWFVVPLGIMQISIPWAIGLCCIAGVVKGGPIKMPDKDDESPSFKMLMIYVGITAYLFAGYICQKLM